ncbi:MAG: ABC transporter permease [Flavobacteriaceae bacterium]|nr:ABC transporter permease [Flavobacteriaceae bacterium]
MKRLFLIEFDKLYANRISRILIVGYFALMTSIALIAAIKFDIGPIKFHLAEQGIFNFPYIWHFNTFVAAWFKLFLAIVIVSMIANEYSNKTIKQNLIDGLSKKEFLLSKFLVILFLSLVSTLYIFVISLALGLTFSNYTELGIVFSEMEYLLAFFIKLIGFFSFCFFLGVLIKRSAFALGFLILWQAFEGIFYGFMRWKLFHDEKTADIIAQFLPLNSMGNLINEPFSRLSAVKKVASEIGQDIGNHGGVEFYEIFIVLGWIGVFIFLSLKLLQSRDL